MHISEDSVKPQNDIEMVTLLSNGNNTKASDECGTLESDFTSKTTNCVYRFKCTRSSTE